MEPLAAYDLIRRSCFGRPDLRFKNWNEDEIEYLMEIGSDFGLEHDLAGYCYIATEVFCILVEGAKPWCAHDRMHFWAQVGETVWDPTETQFKVPYDYSKGRPTSFKQLSKRANSLLATVMSEAHGAPWQVRFL